MRPDEQSVQGGPFERQCQAQDRLWHELGRALDDAPDRCLLDPDGVEAGDQRAEPVREVDDIRAW